MVRTDPQAHRALPASSRHCNRTRPPPLPAKVKVRSHGNGARMTSIALACHADIEVSGVPSRMACRTRCCAASRAARQWEKTSAGSWAFICWSVVAICSRTAFSAAEVPLAMMATSARTILGRLALPGPRRAAFDACRRGRGAFGVWVGAAPVLVERLPPGSDLRLQSCMIIRKCAM